MSVRDGRMTPGGGDGPVVGRTRGAWLEFEDQSRRDGSGGRRGRHDARERHLVELTLLAMVLPLLVIGDGQAAWGNGGRDALMEDIDVPAAGAAAPRDGQAAGDLMAMAGGGMPVQAKTTGAGPGLSDGEDASGDGGFAVAFAADMAAPSTLDHLWSGDGRGGGASHGLDSAPVQAGGGMAARGGSGGGAVDGGLVALEGEGGGAVGGGVDHAALLEAGFWQLFGEVVKLYPDVLGVLSMLVADPDGDGEGGLLVETGGEAVAVGLTAVAFGDVAGVLHHNDDLTIATGYTYFEAMSRAIDGQLAAADTTAWANFTGADIVLTWEREVDSASGPMAFSTSRIDYYALDYADWQPAAGTVMVRIEEASAFLPGFGSAQASDAGEPGQVASVSGEVAAVAPGSIATVTTHSLAQDNFYTSVSAQALFGGAV